MDLAVGISTLQRTVDDVFEKVPRIYDSRKRTTAEIKLHNDGFAN
jgi:hypothetical protein